MGKGKVLQHESGSTELNTFSGPREDPRHTGVTGNARRDGLMVSGWMDEKPTKISNKVCPLIPGLNISVHSKQEVRAHPPSFKVTLSRIWSVSEFTHTRENVRAKYVCA